MWLFLLLFGVVGFGFGRAAGYGDGDGDGDGVGVGVGVERHAATAKVDRLAATSSHEPQHNQTRF